MNDQYLDQDQDHLSGNDEVGNDNEDYGYGDEESIRDPSEVEFLEDTPPTSIIKAILQNISSYWSDHFITDNSTIIYGFQAHSQSRNIKLHVKNLADLAHTWLMDIEQCSEGMETHWTDTLLAKIIRAPYLPKDTAKEFPKRLPVKFSDKQAENYFTSHYMGAAGKKIPLPSVIFSHDWVKMPSTDDGLFEFYGRQGALDGQITHQLLTLERDIITNITEVIDCIEVKDSSAVHLFTIKEALKCLADTNTLATQSNYRAKSMSIVTACKAKLNVRELILNKYTGDNSIKEALKGSNFYSPQLFGPISSTLQDKLDSYINRSEAKLSPKPYHSKPNSSNNSKRGRGSNPQRGARKASYYYLDNYNSGNNVGTSQYVQPAPAPSRQAAASSNQSNPLFHDRPRHQERGRRGQNKKKRGSRYS